MIDWFLVFVVVGEEVKRERLKINYSIRHYYFFKNSIGLDITVKSQQSIAAFGTIDAFYYYASNAKFVTTRVLLSNELFQVDRVYWNFYMRRNSLRHFHVKSNPSNLPW